MVKTAIGLVLILGVAAPAPALAVAPSLSAEQIGSLVAHRGSGRIEDNKTGGKLFIPPPMEPPKTTGGSGTR